MVIILAVVIIIILKVAGVGALKNAPLPLPSFTARPRPAYQSGPSMHDVPVMTPLVTHHLGAPWCSRNRLVCNAPGRVPTRKCGHHLCMRTAHCGLAGKASQEDIS